VAIELRFDHAQEPLREWRQFNIGVPVVVEHPLLDRVPEQIG
jgi:hypothetical protein